MDRAAFRVDTASLESLVGRISVYRTGVSPQATPRVCLYIGSDRHSGLMCMPIGIARPGVEYSDCLKMPVIVYSEYADNENRLGWFA